MSKRKMFRGVLVSVLVATIVVGNATKIVQASQIKEAVSETEVKIVEGLEMQGSSRAARLVWYYKEEGGKKYMRLYDATNEKWLTDWILCD